MEGRDRFVGEEDDRSIETLVAAANPSATLELQPAALAPATKRRYTAE